MSDLIGKILDNTYRIEEQLGSGGMGAVYRGQDIALDRSVAIKVMHSHIAQQPGFRDRFLQEARAIANLEHPGVVQVYSFSRNPELLYIAMAYVPGQNLRDWLDLLTQKGLIVSLPESLALVEAVAEALAYAHRRGVYHRDIKPGNIILRPLDADQLTESGLTFQPVVTDFGLAKLAEGGVHSMTGMSMGTPAYMAPEQCEGRAVDGRADIYALGIVLYELVTGQVPFEVRTLTEAIRAHTQQAPAPPRSLVPELPSQVEEVILKALAKSPEDRHASAADLARALRSARLSLPQPEEATLAAPVQAGRASLVTMMAKAAASGAKPPATPESRAWPTPPSEIPSGGRIVILGPDGQPTAVPFGARSTLTIGRREGNDVVLPDNQASRQHLQITIRENKYYITDLNSTNGSFLGNTRLLPGVAEEWRPEQPLRIGDHWMRLELPGAPPSAPSRDPSYARAPTPPPSADPIQVDLDNASLQVEPGGAVHLAVRILNRQPQVDHFITSVRGLPEAWIKQPVSALRLAPGDMGTVTLSLQPPKHATSRAGRHDFQIQVVSQSNPSHSAVTAGALNIAPFHSIAMELTPSSLVNAGQTSLRLANQGNTAETISLSAADSSESLVMTPSHSQFQVAAGQMETIPLPIRPRSKRPWLGNPSNLPFTIIATTGGGDAASVGGTMTIKPFLPTWAIPLLTTLALLICAGGALAYTSYQKKQDQKVAQQTAQAGAQTATAVAALALSQTQTAQQQGTIQAATAAAMSQSEAQTATASVATATADWLAADSDGDGLTNEQEQQWGTDPNNKDTDGDTLPDGQEAAMNISPISKDTDGDGIQDNVDPDPGNLPTPTPPPSETPEPTATATLTLTPEPSVTPSPTPKYFGQNQLNSFSVTSSPLGKVDQVCLQHNNAGASPDWYVEYVEVDSGSGYVRYDLNRWIATDKADGSLTACIEQPTPTATKSLKIVTSVLKIGTAVFKIGTPVLKVQPLLRVTLVMPLGTLQPVDYKVRIKTGGAGEAGTLAKVSIKLISASGDSGWKTLN